MVMYCIYNSDTLEQLIDTVHYMHNQTTWNEKLFAGKIHYWYQWYLSEDGVGHCAINSILLEINFLWNRIDFFKGTQAFTNPTDLASSRCVGKCFLCTDTWFCWCQGKNFPYNIICLFAKLLPNVSDYCCCHWLLYFLICYFNRTVTFMADLIAKCGRCYCHLDCIFYWLLLLPMIVADVVAKI